MNRARRKVKMDPPMMALVSKVTCPDCGAFTLVPGQAVGIKEVHDDIWLVSFMDYDVGYFDLETRVLEPLENPFGPKVLPMS